MFDLNKELLELAESAIVDWRDFDSSTFLITGASGLIGSLCAKSLLMRNRDFDSQISLLLPVRDLNKARKVFSSFSKDERLSFIPIEKLSDIEKHPMRFDYLIHAASPTTSEHFLDNPVDTIQSIVGGTSSVLSLACKTKIRSAVYISSMEVYGVGRGPSEEPAQKLTEDDLGYINPLKVRSCYPESKRMAECLACSYASQYGLPVKIARLAQTFGPGVRNSDSRLFMQLARSVIANKDIHLRTRGESTRMYCYTLDAVSAIFAVLTRGKNGHAYNVANEDTYGSVYDFALYAAQVSGDKIKVVIDDDPDAPFPPEHHLPLDTAALRGLGWSAQYPMSTMFQNLIHYLS